MTRSQIRTMLKRAGFIAPKNCIHYSHTRNGRESFPPYNKMNFMKSQGTIVNFGSRCYRIRKTEDSWVVDVSCTLDKFDRWSNSKYYDSIPIEIFSEFCNKYLIRSKRMMENFPSMLEIVQEEMFDRYVGIDHPNWR